MSKTLRNIKYQTIQLLIPAANAVVSTKAVTTDRSYKKVKAIGVNVSDAAAAEKGVFNKFEIGNIEIYPDGFESKRLSCGQNVAPNERYDKEVNETAENSSVSITYTDNNALGTAFPYAVSVYLWLENPID
jgi:hypothetical protein